MIRHIETRLSFLKERYGGKEEKYIRLIIKISNFAIYSVLGRPSGSNIR